MKFNNATLYKVPFDNSYKNVVDYHMYNKHSSVLIKDLDVQKEDIITCRAKYFYDLPKYTAYNNRRVCKSVKVIGNRVECSIALDWETIKDYNYIIFADYPPGQTYTDIYLHCFIIDVVSENDGDTPSSRIICEIDYWTQYIDSIQLDTPNQFEAFAHEPVNRYNGKFDKRLPADFIHRNTFKFLTEDYILFIRVSIDRSYFDPQYTTTRGRFDPAGGVVDYAYVPFMAVRKSYGSYNYELITGYEYKNTDGTALSSDASDAIKKYGYFGFYDDERIRDAKLTPFTPFGVFKASEHTTIAGGKRHFISNVNMFWIDNGNNYVMPFEYTKDNVTYKHYIYHPGAVGSLFNMGAIFATDNVSFLPVDNEDMWYVFTKNFTDYKNIRADYNANYERKLFQYPFWKESLIYNGSQFNITPEPTGSNVQPQIILKIKVLNDIRLEITNESQIADVFSIILNNNASVPTSVDAYKSYALKQLESDMLRLGTQELGSIAAIIAGVAIGNPMIAVGGATAGVNALSNVGANVAKAKNTPDSIIYPSNNAFDNIYTACPIVKTSELKDEDKETISSLWRRNGYPINEYRPFTMYRFWYDYKQTENACLSNITNSLARKTIENALNAGMVIWHANIIDDEDIYIQTIGNFTANNPSNNDCTEVS